MRRIPIVLLSAIILGFLVINTALAHDCSSPDDCLKTAGYNAIIALVGGFLGIVAALFANLFTTLDRSKETEQVRVYIETPLDLTIQTCGRDIVFRARTEPPGREADIQWDVPLDQYQTVSSGAGPEFVTGWTETGVKQVVARLDQSADDVILFVFKTSTGGAALADILNAAPPPIKRGPEGYKTYRQHEIPQDTADTPTVEG